MMMNGTKEFQIMMSPGRARLLSMVAISALFGGYLGSAIVGKEPGPFDIGMSILKLTGLVSTIILFLSNYGQMSQRKESQLDEREAQIRNRAYVLTHQIMVVLAFIAFFWLESAHKLGWWLPDPREAANLITAYALGSMALPAAILAWRDTPISDD